MTHFTMTVNYPSPPPPCLSDPLRLYSAAGQETVPLTLSSSSFFRYSILTVRLLSVRRGIASWGQDAGHHHTLLPPTVSRGPFREEAIKTTFENSFIQLHTHTVISWLQFIYSLTVSFMSNMYWNANSGHCYFFLARYFIARAFHKDH